ncbi:flowering time control protein FPA isoform X1 [Tripterygium wilfordii]|uniref:Flowering time control protein FPA isoform X1 n=1 Tax=Tripterygium wilfordii TaxID=458696 RepID=A0A7J7CIM1_TRIWF|nr:flowering time control protein FPA [Tripterygium wilfordii]KAF5733912.1 flowering time control protein FPA isoform X1 [Tripterygium wilfordii]
MKSSRPGHGGDDVETPSNNLWIGNLSTDVTDEDLMDLFGKFGALDSVTTYSSRSFAFLYFKRVEDAKAAKESLQGAVVRGNPVKIEFARPAKPCKNLWVGGISTTVSKEQLEEEFLKFGKIEEFRFLRDRNTAFIEYSKLEDASQAMKSMNGRRIGGVQIRVDFLRSQPSRREQLPDFRNSRESQIFGSHSIRRPQVTQSSMGRKGDGQPSNILWIGYPPSVQIDEQMLHNAMILFGEIERIKSFPSRNYSFVEFRSVEEARRAKEGLQGRLFNDPRITIMYSSSGLAPGKDYPAFYPEVRGATPDLYGEHLFGTSQVDMLGHNLPPMPNNFAGLVQPSSILGSNMPMRPTGSGGGIDPPLSGPDFDDLAALHTLRENFPDHRMGPNRGRQSSPAPGMLPSPASRVRPHMRSVSGGWDVYETQLFQGDAKRSRVDGTLPIDDASFSLRNIDDKGLGSDRSYGRSPTIDEGILGPYTAGKVKNRLSPVGARMPRGGPVQGHLEDDYIWRGIIAKGGTPVCHARCIPIGKGIGSELPNVVNCSARTGLDMLAKHCAEAVGFDIVFFLPDSEDDFASYTEFLCYLGSKNRAGVAKLDDGTTLFLVPPSDFLIKVLKVTGPERLYGVVLELPLVHDSATVQRQLSQPIPSSGYIDRQQMRPPHADYSLNPKEEQVLQGNYSGVIHEDAKLPTKYHSKGSESLALQSVTKEYASNKTTAFSQAGVALTPELIATLTSLLPVSTQSSALENVQVAPAHSISRHSVPSVVPDRGSSAQGWRPDSLVSEKSEHLLQQLGNSFNSHAQGQSQLHSYPTVPHTLGHTNAVASSTQIQDSSANRLQHSINSSRPSMNMAIPSQSGQYTVSPRINQPYPFEAPEGTQGHGMMHGMDVPMLYNPSVAEQPNNHISMSNHSLGANYPHSHSVVTSSADPANMDIPNQVQQLQSVHPVAGQGTSEGEDDKDQRYRKTLELAANLLLRIQNQQQTGAPTGEGS